MQKPFIIEYLFEYFEQKYPVWGTMLCVAIYFAAVWTGVNLPSQDHLNTLMNVSLSLSGILLGLIGVMIGMWLSILDRLVIKVIYKNHVDVLLLNYIKNAFLSNVILFVVSGIGLWVTLPRNMSLSIYFAFAFWIVVFSYAFFSTTRIVYLLFKILEKTNEIVRDEYNPKTVIDKVAEKDIDTNRLKGDIKW